MQLRSITADDGLLIKRVRLHSLKDAPHAFGVGSFDEESALPDAHWHELAAQLGGCDPRWQDRCVGFILLDGDDACGTATCYLCPSVTGRAYFTSAWIDPRYRRRGLGRQLVDAAIAWAKSHNADHLRLWVDDTNPSAVQFYQALGFVPTGETQPIHPDAAELQSAFERSLAAP